ncbi:MAG TPA: cell division protein ZapA [Thermodesulfovibrionales bacterium]|nr:cell division protein ZapA [Thermodesulfovibrionales bacterium]
MGSVEVYILGQKYTIKGDSPEEYIRKLASYVDAKLMEVNSSLPNMMPVKALILTSLNIADELFRLRNEQETLAKVIEDKADVLTALFD